MKKLLLPLFFTFLFFFNGFGQTSMQIVDVNLYGKKIVCPDARTSLYFKYDGASPFEQKGQKFIVQLIALNGKITEIDGFPTDIDRDYSNYKYSTISFITPNLTTGFYTIKLKITQPKILISDESKVYVLNSFPQISFFEPEKIIFNSASTVNPTKLIVNNEVESNNLQIELNDKRTYSLNLDKSLYLNPSSDFAYKIERIIHECGTSEVKNSSEKQVKNLDDIIITNQGENIQCIGKTHKINFSVKDKSKLLNRKFITEIYDGSAVLKTIPTLMSDSTAQFQIPEDLPMGRYYSMRLMSEDKFMISNYSGLNISSLRLPNFSLLTKEITAKSGEVLSFSGTIFNTGDAKLLFDNGQIIGLFSTNRKIGIYNVGEDTNSSLGKNGQGSITNNIFYNENRNLRITGISNICGTQPLDLTIKINTPKEVKVVDFPKSICGDTKFQIKIDDGENIKPNDYEIRFFNSYYNYSIKNDIFSLKNPTLTDKGTLNFQMTGIENYRRVNFFVIVHKPTGNTSTLKPIILRKAIPVVMYANTYDRFNHAITVTTFDIDATYDDTLRVSLDNGKQLLFNKLKTSETFPVFSDKPFKLATTKIEHVCGNFSLNFETSTNPNSYNYVPMAIEKSWGWVCEGSTIKTRFINVEDFSKVANFRLEYRTFYNGFSSTQTLKFKKTDQDIEFEAPSQGGKYYIRLVAADGRSSNEIPLDVLPKNLKYPVYGNTLLENPELLYVYFSNEILQKSYFNNRISNIFSSKALFIDSFSKNQIEAYPKNFIFEDEKGIIYQSKNNPVYAAFENTVYTVKEIETACEVLKPNQKFEFIKTPYIFSTELIVPNQLCSGEEFSINLRKFNNFPKNTKYSMKFYESNSDSSPVVFEAPMKEDTINSKLVMKVPDVGVFQGKFIFMKAFASIDGKEYTQANGFINTQINQVSTAKLSALGNALTIELAKNSIDNYGTFNQGSSFYFSGQKYTANSLLKGNYFIANIRNRCGFIKTDGQTVNLLGDSTQNRAYLSQILNNNVYQNCVNDSLFLNINTISYYSPPYIFTDNNGVELFRTNQAIEYKKLKTDIKYLDAIRLKTGNKSVNTEKGFSLFNVPDIKVKGYAAVYANEVVLIEEANNGGGLAVKLTTDDANEFYLNKGILKPENKVYKIKQAENMCGKVTLEKDIKIDVINDVALKTEPFINSVVCKNDTLSVFYNLKSGSLKSDNTFALQMYDDKGTLVGEMPSANQQTYPINFKLNENLPIGEYYLRLKTSSPASVGASSSTKQSIEETSTAKISDIKRPTPSNSDAVVTIELNNKSKNVTTNNSIVLYKINDEIKKVSAEDIRSFNLFVPYKNSPPVFELLKVSSNTCKNWKIEGEKKVTIELITALEENENVKIYPNPTSDFISIEGIESMNKGSVELFSSNGKSVLKESIENLKTENKINIKDLPSGVYILKIYDDKKVIAFKLSKF